MKKLAPSSYSPYHLSRRLASPQKSNAYFCFRRFYVLLLDGKLVADHLGRNAQYPCTAPVLARQDEDGQSNGFKHHWHLCFLERAGAHTPASLDFAGNNDIAEFIKSRQRRGAFG